MFCFFVAFVCFKQIDLHRVGVGEGDEKHIYFSSLECFRDCMLKKKNCFEPSKVFEEKELDLILRYDVVTTLKAVKIVLRSLEGEE